MIILRDKSFSSPKSDNKTGRVKKPKLPKRALDPTSALSGFAVLAGPSSIYGAYNGSRIASLISRTRQKKDFYNSVNKFGGCIKNSVGENVKDYVEKNKPLVDLNLDIKTINSERTKKAKKKGAIVGAAIPIGLAAFSYAKQLHNYKKRQKEMEKYKKDYNNWKKYKDKENDTEKN